MSKFCWDADEVIITQCVFCEHRHETGPGCEAFPAGIPDAIQTNSVDHRKPYPGDHGIRFEAADARGMPEQLQRYLDAGPPA